MTTKTNHKRSIGKVAARSLLSLAIILAAAHPAWAAQASLQATVSPRQIPLGRTAQLSVEITGTQAAKPELESVDGLKIFATGQSQRMQIINGEVSAAVTYIFEVQPTRAGEFEIPPIEASIDGKPYRTEAIKLTVDQSSGPNTAASALSAPHQAPAQPSGQPIEASEEELAQRSFLRIMPTKTSAYVGEVIPIEIQAYFSSEVRPRTLVMPQFSGDSLTTQQISKEPRQSQEIIDGRRCSVLSWQAAVSPVKSGEMSLQASLNGTAVVHEPLRKRPSPFGRTHSLLGRALFDDPWEEFNDDLFEDFFQQGREQEIQLKSAPDLLEVIDLPLKGRPVDFSGAVGRFTMQAWADRKEVTAGDPVTLNITISGDGNLDRVSAPQLTGTAGWKLYAPRSSTNDAGASGINGEKHFEQVLTPESESITQMPAVRFNFFDPHTAKYKTLENPPIPLSVTAAAQGPAGAKLEPAAASINRQDPAQAANFFPAGIFFQICSAVALCLLTFAATIWHQKRKFRLQTSASSAKDLAGAALDQAEVALAANDGLEFFRASRRAVQERLGALWRVAPESLTAGDIEQRLQEKGRAISTLFAASDAACYAHRRFTAEELRCMHSALQKELQMIG